MLLLQAVKSLPQRPLQAFNISASGSSRLVLDLVTKMVFSLSILGAANDVKLVLHCSMKQ